MAIVMDVTKLPHGTFFHVENGGWTGYVEKENGNSIIYCGVDSVEPTEKYLNKFVIPKGYTYDQCIEILSETNRKHSIVLTDYEIDVFMSYIEKDDMPNAFKNTDWLQIFNKIVDYKRTDTISSWIDPRSIYF